MGLFRIYGTTKGLMTSKGVNAMHHMFEMIGIPYKNTKHDFKQLEAMGEEYVKQRML